MEQLIQITREVIGSREVNSVNARDVWEALHVKKDFSNWIKHQIKTLGLERNVDYITFAQKGDGGKFAKIEYIITTNTAKHISMASRTIKGREVRDYFISCEKKLLQGVTSNGAFIHQFIKTQSETNTILLKNMELQTKLLQSLVDDKNKEDRRETITKEQMKKIRSNVFITLPAMCECNPYKSQAELSRQLYTELNARFGVTSYYDILKDDFDEVIELQEKIITHWEEKREVALELKKADLERTKKEIFLL